MECSVCLNLYNTTDRYAVKLICSHLVCSICCLSLKSKNISKCPICLKPDQLIGDLSKCETIDNMLLALDSHNEIVFDENIKIILRNLRGNFSEIIVKKDVNISTLKKTIENIESVNPASQWLLHNGRALTDSQTLQSSGVGNGDIIYLVVRSFGG